MITENKDGPIPIEAFKEAISEKSAPTNVIAHLLSQLPRDTEEAKNRLIAVAGELALIAARYVINYFSQKGK